MRFLPQTDQKCADCGRIDSSSIITHPVNWIGKFLYSGRDFKKYDANNSMYMGITLSIWI